MSKKDNITGTPAQEEKIVTRYERKLQKRAEAEAKAKKENKIIAIGTAIIAAAILALLISFPVRNYMAVNSSYVEIGGEKISQVEFDYYYGVAFSNYYNQYGAYLTYYGVDLTGDLSTIMYTEDMTYEQFFQQTAVENIKRNQALNAEADAKGFEFDAEAEWESFKEAVKDQAAAQNISLNRFLQAMYGSYASLNRIEQYVREGMRASAYSAEIADDMLPTEEEILAYYEENKDEFDVVDYRITTIEAELPTGETAAEGEETTEETEEYEPTEEEIATAMAAAKEKADEALKTIATEGELKEGAYKGGISSHYQGWLFDEARATGDTTVVEDTTNNKYYVVAFEKRYREENPTVNARVLSTSEDPQAYLDEWKAGAADEESFAALCDKYSEDGVEGGLNEGITNYNLPTDIADWLFAEERAYGDTTAITQESGSNYVIFYKEAGENEWKMEIQYTLQSEAMAAHIAEITADIEVRDPKGNLEFLELLGEE